MRLNLKWKRNDQTEPDGRSVRIPDGVGISDGVVSESSCRRASEGSRRADRGEGRKEREECVEASGVSDESLFAAYRDRQDVEAFESLVHRYETELFHYLSHYLGDATLAQDVFQSTFLAIHTRCETFEEGRRFRPWLYAVATHQAIDAQRRLRRHRSASLDASMRDTSDRRGSEGDESRTLYSLLGDDSPDPAVRLGMVEDAEAVRRAVDDLPDLLRQVVHLVYFQGLRYREAADALGVPVGTVKSRLHAAMNRLARSFVPSDVSSESSVSPE
ncbi:MAG: RNA polymerase sigma factor [Planctomycetia bacterium]|nr:RNA polymerase sigma factor [Planctomycetia bacterium]